MCELNHSHCHNFCPIDVAKGLCRLSGTLIMTDSPRCEHFSEKPRCGNCHHFCDQSTPVQCQGLGKIYWADANANASLCEAFARR